MSQDFIKMVSEIHSERFLLQLQNLAVKKIPCGLFAGFSVPNNFAEIINNVKSSGINLTCVCTIDALPEEGGGMKI